MSNIVNTYFKFNFVQYIFIIFLICGTIIHKNNKSYSIIKKYDSIYKIMNDHYQVSKYVKNVIQLCNINHYHILNRYQYQNNKH